MSEQTTEETMSSAERKRFFLLSGVFVLLAALITGAVIYFTSGDDEADIKSTVQLSAEDRAEGEKVAKDFITQTSTWGLRTDKVNADNMKDVSYIVQQNTQTANTYWYNRNQNYEAVKTNFIAPDSKLWYEPARVQSWWDPIAREVMADFRPLEVKVQVPERGSRLTVGDTETDAMIVPVSYTVKQTKRMATSTDMEWDGTYSVLERNYQEDAQLVLVRMGDGWRVYSLTGNQYPFLLTVWATPDEDYNAEQHGFQEVDRVKVKLGNS